MTGAGASRACTALAVMIAFAAASPSGAQTAPADCSVAAIPARPVMVSLAGTQFEPKSIKLQRSGGMKSDKEYDTYSLAFRSVDDIFAPLESSVTFLVPKGRQPGGRTFRRLPTKETGKQPLAEPGVPEIQGWSLKQREPAIDLNHVLYIGSLRLELGRRQGKTIAGKIYLCVAAGQTTLFDKTPTKEPSFVVGSFTAQLD